MMQVMVKSPPTTRGSCRQVSVPIPDRETQDQFEQIRCGYGNCYKCNCPGFKESPNDGMSCRCGHSLSEHA